MSEWQSRHNRKVDYKNQGDLKLSVKEPPLPKVIIKPTRGIAGIQLKPLWEYRELLYFLVWRDVKGRYRQMAFGPLWIILQPLIQMLIFTLVFGRIAKLPSEGIPYPIFVYVALLPWQFFANGTRLGSQSLVSQKHVIAKVYFPRLIIPISSVIASFIDFLASFVVLMVMMIVFKVSPTLRLLTLPFFLLLAAMLALGIGFWLAGLAVKYRDVALAVTFILTIWQYLTPVAYSATLIADEWLWIYQSNPMYSVIEGFRWAIFETGVLSVWSLVVTVCTATLLLISGIFYFRSK